MKNLLKLTLIIAALGLSACAHETTQMDRELALKLVDKAGRIEIVQTNNGNPSQNLLGAQGQAQAPQSALQAIQQQNAHVAQSCRSQPMYDLYGNYYRTDVQCF